MADTQYTDLLEPVLTGGVHRTNFFNGRVLTAEDLQTEQEAEHDEHAALGRAVGEGVVWGYEIGWGKEPPRSGASGSSGGAAGQHTILQIEPGFALNRLGEGVRLAASAQLRLAGTGSSLASTGDFHCCTQGVATLTNSGLYILTVSPATGYGGSAPAVGLDQDGVAGTCASGYQVEGVCFGMTNVDLSAATGLGAEAQAALLAAETALEQGSGGVAVSYFRSCVAHYFLGSDNASFASNPFPAQATGSNAPPYPVSPQLEWPPLDDFFDRKILDAGAVPLALIYWSSTGVQFVDWWAVRRPLFRIPASAAWAPLAGGRDTAVGLAAFLQFQQQLDELETSVRKNGKATDLFRFLPSAGLLRTADFANGVSGFFSGLDTGGPTAITDAKLHALVLEALSYPPIDLTDPATTSGVQRYLVGTATYELFTTRATHGPLESDRIADTFLEAWEAYRDLSHALLLLFSGLPAATGASFRGVERLFASNELSTAETGITFGGTGRILLLLNGMLVVRDIMHVAQACYTLAAGRHLDRETAVQAFGRLEKAQEELTSGVMGLLLATRIVLTQAGGTAAEDLFNKIEELLKALLDAIHALGQAVERDDLGVAVKRQLEIDKIIERVCKALAEAAGGSVSEVATGTIAGRVTLSGIPAVGAKVSVVGTSLAAVTSVTGAYTIAGVPTGTQTVEVSYQGETGQKQVEVQAGKTANGDIAGSL